jgi:multiple sugar transport system substrate-binding protein
MSPARIVRFASIALGCAMLAVSWAPPSMAQTKELTIWTMGGDQPGWVKWLEGITANFEKNNPGAKAKITYYEKTALGVALRTALRAGQGPDVLYTEPDQKEYAENGFLRPMNDLLNWDNVEPWAKGAWSTDDKVWGVPYSAYTNEIYYNKDLMKELGVTIPPNGQVSQAEFINILKKAKAANVEPLVIGAGDRPFTGAYISFEPMLRKLGPADYQKLLDGKLSYADPRVVEVLNFVKEVADLGALPKSFASLSLTDSYQYFFHRKGLMFPQGTLYSQRAFAPADRGGQPDNFNMGVMNYPAMNGGACNNCRTLAISGGYSVNADTKNVDLAKGFLKELATPEMGNLWMVNNNSVPGVKADTSKITGKYAGYFKELDEMKKGSAYFVGIPLNFVSGQCRETFVQVINVGLPAGLVSVEDTVKRMNAACYKG